MKPSGHSRDDALTATELDQLVNHAESPRERVTIRLAGWWGLRCGEISHLNQRWLSGQKGTLTIPSRCGCRVCREGDRRWRPKRAASNRTLPIREHVESWESVRIYLENHPTPETSIVDRRTTYKVVARVADRAGFIDQRVYPHALRATAAHMFASMGFNAFELCRIMGWSNLREAEPYISSSGGVSDASFGEKRLKWW